MQHNSNRKISPEPTSYLEVPIFVPMQVFKVAFCSCEYCSDDTGFEDDAMSAALIAARSTEYGVLRIVVRMRRMIFGNNRDARPKCGELMYAKPARRCTQVLVL